MYRAGEFGYKAKMNDDDTISLSDIDNKVGELLSLQKSDLNNKESEYDYELLSIIRLSNDSEDNGTPGN